MEANIAFVHRFLTSLIFTTAVETAMLVLLLRFVFRNSWPGRGRVLTAGLFASFMTLPYVWYIIPALFPWPTSLHLIVVAEAFAFVIETLFYRSYLRVGWGTALTLSLAANALSYFLGPLLRSYGFWIYW